MSKKPSFTNINYSVCTYCTNVMIYEHIYTIDITLCCKIRTDANGRYKNLGKYENKEDELVSLNKKIELINSADLGLFFYGTKV